MNFKETKLNALYTFSSGLSKGKKFFGYGYPFLSYKTIFNNYYLPNRLDELVDATEKERNKCSIKRGDVFLTRTSETVDEIGISSVALKTYPNATFNGFAKRLRPITDDILPEYAAYYFRSRYFRTKASSLCTLITRASLNNNDLSYLTILYPEFAVQKIFASLLLSYDKLIENNTRRIQILEEMAQRIYKEWFVDFKYPGHENDQLVESEVGMIPEGWEVGTVNEIVDIKSGFAFKSSTFDHDGLYGLVTIKNVQDGNFIPKCQSHIYVTPGNMPEYCFLNSGDIILSLTGNVGRVCVVHGENYLLNQRVAKLIPKNIADRAFIYSLYRNNAFQRSLEMISTGTAQQNLSPILMGKYSIIVPCRKILSLFADICNPILTEILLLYIKNKNLSQTRDLLLPKLISGKVDVSNLDIDTSILHD